MDKRLNSSREKNIMLKRHKQLLTLCAMAAMLSPLALRAQRPQGSQDVPVQLIVTVSTKHDKQPPPLVTRQDVAAYQGHDKLEVLNWLPLRDEHAGLELAIVIDDTANSSLNGLMGDVRSFISSQPATTAVLVGYASNGTVQITQNFTKDHVLAAKAVRLPLGNGGAFASPYLSMIDLLKRWPDSKERHEVLLISDGVDRFRGGLDDPDVATLYEEAQRHTAIIHTLFVSGIGHLGHNAFRVMLAQSNLGQVSDESGGEAFAQGFQTPVALEPYLQHLQTTLDNQYLLTVNVRAGNKPRYDHIRVSTELSGVELLVPGHIYVPAASQQQ
jgi:hypothetical protein